MNRSAAFIAALLCSVSLASMAHAQAVVPINSLPSVTTPLGGGESVPVVQGGQTRKAPSAAFGVPIFSTSAPSAPIVGQQWYNTTSSPYVLNVWDGAQWDQAGTFDPTNHVVKGNEPCVAFGQTIGTCAQGNDARFPASTPLLAANNLSDIANAATARTNLGLGSAAVQNVSAFLQPTNNLSDLSNAVTARTNLGLGSAATQNTGTSGGSICVLNTACTFSGLIGASAGITLPTSALGNIYLDGNGAFHVLNSNGDFQGFGAKAAGDSSRSWFTAPYGSFIVETTSGQQPNTTCQRQDKFNGGTGLSFCNNTTYTQGNGVTVKPTAYVASGSVGPFAVTANANIAIGDAVFGPGIPNGDTVAAYTTGQLTLSVATNAPLYTVSPINVILATNNAPTNQAVAIQGTCLSYTIQTTTTQTCNGANGYVFKNAPSTNIIEGGNILCNDQTGLSSLIAGACIGAELDVVAEDQDNGLSRMVLDLIQAEGGPALNPTTFGYGVRLRPGAAGAQYQDQNPVRVLNGFIVSTMPQIPGVTGGGGGWGSYDEAFKCDGGINIGCFDAISGALQFQTTSVALSGQNQLLFVLGKNINIGQYVSGDSHIPAGDTVTASYQCAATHQRTECGSNTSATLVVLAQNLTGNVAGSTALTFTGAFFDGSQFAGYFNDALANWTNYGGKGLIKAGTTLNTGTVLTLSGIGEDSANTTGIEYGRIDVKEKTNTAGSVVGEIDLVPAGNGVIGMGSAVNPLTGTVLNVGGADSSIARIQLNAFGNAAIVTAARAGGTNASPTAVLNADLLASFNGYGQYDTTVGHIGGPAGAYRIYAEGNFSASSWPTEGCIATTPSGSTTLADVFCVHQDAGVTIGAPTGGDEGANTLNVAGTIYVNGVAVGTSSETVTTTGSPASGNLAKFSGATSITNGDLSGDCTTSGTLVITCTKSNGTALTALFAPLASPTGTGILTWPQLSVSGSVSAAAWTTSGLGITAPASTWTDTTSSGTVATMYGYKIGGQTIAASSATTYTSVYALDVEPLVQGSGATFTTGRAAFFNASIQINGSVLNNSSTGAAMNTGSCNSATFVAFEPNRNGATGGLGCHNVAGDWGLIGGGTEGIWGDATKVTLNMPLVFKGYTVSTLPTGITGAKAYVTDAVACTFLAAPSGSGSTFCPVVYNGTSWVAE